MKLRKPTKADYDFFAVVIDGVYLDHLVYCDDYEDGFICYLCDRNGGWKYHQGDITFKRKQLLKLPESMGNVEGEV